MNIKGIDHIAIQANDFEETIRFYRDVLGFTEGRLVDVGRDTLKYLLVADGTRIEIFNPGDRNPYQYEDRIKHIAFNVNGLNDFLKRIVQSGMEIVLGVTYLTKLDCNVLLFRDPNGIIIELVERNEI